MEEFTSVGAPFSKVPNTDLNCWDPRLGTDVERLTPIEDLKEVLIGPLPHQVTKIGTSLTEEEKHELIDQLIKNVNLFA